MISTPHGTSLKIGNEYNVDRRTIERNAKFAKAVDILPESKKEEVLNQGEKISYPIADKILKMDKPTQKKFIKEIEVGTTIKEAVKKGSASSAPPFPLFAFCPEK